MYVNITALSKPLAYIVSCRSPLSTCKCRCICMYQNTHKA